MDSPTPDSPGDSINVTGGWGSEDAHGPPSPLPAAAIELLRRLRENDPELVTLDFSNCPLGDAGARAGAAALANNTVLRSLKLSGCGVGDPGAAAVADSLAQAHAHGVAELTDLDLSANRIGPAGARALADTLRAGFPLRSLLLWGNPVGEGDGSGAAALAEALEGSPSLLTLALGATSLRPDAAVAFARALRRNSTVTELDFNLCDSFGDAGAALIAAGISGHKSLRSLDLSFCDISDRGATALAAALRDAATALTSLDLSGNCITESGAEEIAAALKVQPNLKSLNLRGNAIVVEGACAFADALQWGAALTALDVGGCGVGDAGCATLAQSLRGASCPLRSLGLSDSLVTCAGVCVLADALEAGASLTRLDLSCNPEALEGGTDSGKVSCAALAAALEASPSLEALALAECGLGDAGLRALAAGILSAATTGRLATLELANNGIGVRQFSCFPFSAGFPFTHHGRCRPNQLISSVAILSSPAQDDGAEALAEVLRAECSALTVLDVSSNAISDAGAAAIAGALRTNAALGRLDLARNEIGAEGAKALRDAAVAREALGCDLQLRL